MDYEWVWPAELVRAVWGAEGSPEELIEAVGGLLPEWEAHELSRVLGSLTGESK